MTGVPFQVVLVDDQPPLDPAMKARLELAWSEWTSTCEPAPDESNPLKDIEQMIERVRAEKLARMERVKNVMISKVLYDLESCADDFIPTNIDGQPGWSLALIEDEHGYLAVDRRKQGE